MGAAYSQDLRDRVLAARARGMKTRQVARTFEVSESWVRRVMQRKREHGETRPRPRGGITVVKIDMDHLRQLVEQQPDATIRELRARLRCVCSPSAVGLALQRLGLSFKKRRSTPANRTGRTSRRTAGNGGKTSPGVMPAD